LCFLLLALGELCLGQNDPIFTTFYSQKNGVLNANSLGFQIHGNAGSGLSLTNFNWIGNSFNALGQQSNAQQALQVNLLNAHTSVNVNLYPSIPTVLYLYASKWVPGLYSFNNPFTILSQSPKNPGGNNRANASNLVVLTQFTGILQFNAGLSSLSWTNTVKTPGSTANLVFTFAIPTYYWWSTSYNGYNKCYQMTSMLQGRHMPSLNWQPGPCDRSIYTLPDCFTNPDYGWDNQTYYAYRYWQTGAPCPETQCCCASGVNGNPGATFGNWGDCASNYLYPYGNGATCQQAFASPGTPNWIYPCYT